MDTSLIPPRRALATCMKPVRKSAATNELQHPYPSQPIDGKQATTDIKMLARQLHKIIQDLRS